MHRSITLKPSGPLKCPSLSGALCCSAAVGRRGRGAVNAFAELTEDFGGATVRCEGCNHERCCFHRLWRGFSADEKKNRKQKTGLTASLREAASIVFLTTGEVIIPQRIRMLSVEKLQQCSRHLKGKVTIE